MDIQVQQHLLMTKAAAEAMISVAIREDDTYRRGFIEMAAVDGAGNTWIVGWMHKETSPEFAAILHDRQKYPTALKIIADFPRDDIPAGARGVIGLIISEWRPSDHSEASLHYGDGLLNHLRALRPLPVVRMATIISLFEQIKSRSGLSHGDFAAQALREYSDWVPTDLSRLGFALKIEIDSVLVIPGFGCMLRGWAVSPTKQISTMRVKLGSSVLSCDDSMLIGEARPDLNSISPQASSDQAFPGFVGLFVGNVAAEAVQEPLLQIDFIGGTTVTQEITPNKIRLLGVSADIQAITSYYPSIQFESSFGPLAMAIRAFERQRSPRLFEFRVSRVDNTIIVALPPDRSDTAMTFEALRELTPMLSRDTGIVVIASRTHDRAQVASLFDSLVSRTGSGSSLFFIDDARYAFFSLEKILLATSAKRFVFASSGLYLQASGWKALVNHIARASERLTFFRPGPETSADSMAYNQPLSACFGWNAFDFSRYAQGMSGFVGGLHEDNGMMKYAGHDTESLSISGTSFRFAGASPLAVAINSI